MELQVDENQKYFVADSARSLADAACEDELYATARTASLSAPFLHKFK